MTVSKPVAHVMKVEPGRILLAPYGMIRRAREFYDASEFLLLRSKRFSPVGGFLACRAVELAMKAFLRARGDSLKQLRKLSHDISRILIESDVRGLDHYVKLSGEQRKILRLVGRDYSAHRLAYFDIMWTVAGGYEPDPIELNAIALEIVSSLEPVCKGVAQGDGSYLPLV